MVQRKEGQMEHALTKRMNSVTDGLKGKYAALYNTDDYMTKIASLKKCDPDRRGDIQSELVAMFEKCGVEGVKYGQNPEYYYDVLKNNNIPTPEELRYKVYKSFLDEFIKNPFPCPEEYIARMVKGKIAPEWKNDTLRLQILKKFIRDADALHSAGYKNTYIKKYVKEKIKKKEITVQDILDNLEDDIFDCLKPKGSAGDQQKKKDNHQQLRKSNAYGLLKVADDLAHGRFGNANVVREEIYLFAIVFELKFFTGDSEEFIAPEDRDRDIERVMFGDYYSNNLMRYVSEGHRYIKSGGEEQNPTGKGINYKNYMEAIFLYYIRKNDLTIKEKLSHAYFMAEDVHRSYMEYYRDSNGRLEKQELKKNTQFFMDEFKERVLETEGEFFQFLIENYDCHVDPKKTYVFNTSKEQESAYLVYIKLLEDAEEEGVTEEDFKNRGICFLNDVIDTNKIAQVQQERERGTVDFNALDDKTKFDILLYEMDRDLKRRKSIAEIEKRIISRADILRLFYQEYINWIDEDEVNITQSFPAVYDDFCFYANQHLTDAFLRPINGRDLYDLILVYSVYCQLNQDKLDRWG